MIVHASSIGDITFRTKVAVATDPIQPTSFPQGILCKTAVDKITVIHMKSKELLMRDFIITLSTEMTA